MSHDVRCFRCGTSLAELSLPLSRQDMCPQCGVYLHVCRMCCHFDASAPRQCREDGAEDVTEKDRLNFCDWFKPSEHAFDAASKSAADIAQQKLDALFDGAAHPEAEEGLSEAEKLFKG